MKAKENCTCKSTCCFFCVNKHRKCKGRDSISASPCSWVFDTIECRRWQFTGKPCAKFKQLKHTIPTPLREKKHYIVESFSMWFIVKASCRSKACREGYREFGKRNLKSVRVAIPSEVKIYLAQKKEITEV